jgi:L-histidine N-alpha-methyltransferase
MAHAQQMRAHRVEGDARAHDGVLPAARRTGPRSLDRRRLLAHALAGWRLRDEGGFVLHVDVPQDSCLAFARSVARGLADHPRWLDSRWLYDDAGSEIFERITEQPEYYQTRTEERLLATYAGDIRRRAGDATLVELGSGSSAKTHRLLDAWQRHGRCRYVPIDISAGALEAACRDLLRAFPALTVEAIAASYERALPLIAGLSPLQLVFLGSTIGNFDVSDTERFLNMVARSLAPGDTVLLGLDLVKDHPTLELAYNDAAGWSARFTTNLFARMNRELGAEVPLDAVEHVAYYNDRLERIEIYARFRREVYVCVRSLGHRFRIAAGEMVRTEISRKFRPEAVAATAAGFGFAHEITYVAPDDSFALLLLRRHGRPWWG